MSEENKKNIKKIQNSVVDFQKSMEKLSKEIFKLCKINFNLFNYSYIVKNKYFCYIYINNLDNKINTINANVKFINIL